VNPHIPGTTESVDAVFLYIFGIAALMLVGITATMIYFIIRYHHGRHPHAEPSPRHSVWLEVAWTLVPTLIVLTMFWYSWKGYLALVNVPADALKVDAVGQQWTWSFTYENGKTSDRLVVPAGRAIRVSLTSRDVIHSLFIPAFRVKKDAVPGIVTHVWFRASEPNTYDLFCAEYCGVGHSAMISKVEVLPKEEFDRWLSQKEAPQTATAGDRGIELLTRFGCIGCHSLDGSKRVGPTFKGFFGHRITVQTAGKNRELVVDRDYIRRSIQEPGADLVEGYPPVMPPFQGRVTEAELDTLVDFLAGQTDGDSQH
jgi:cytochrome c oxidase subunit 2